MQITETAIPGARIIRPDVFRDDRGLFLESYNQARYRELGLPDFLQDNVSVSKKGVLRGLHYQAPPMDQGKLVSVVRGRVFDVAVDIRFGSPTFGQFVSIELSADEPTQFFIPAGFAHGFMALEDDTVFTYKCTNVYSPAHDRGMAYDDPAIGIVWPLPATGVSAKDKQHPRLAEIREEFTYSA